MTVESDEVRERLVRIETKLDFLLEDRIDNRERFRSLERWKYGIPPAVFIAIASLVTAASGWTL